MENNLVKKEVDLNHYTEQEQERIRELASQIPLGDSGAVMLYGTNAQSKMTGFSDSMLKTVKQKEIGEIGEVLGDLMSKLHDVDPKDFEENGGIFGKLMRRVRKTKENMLMKYQDVNTQVGEIVNQLEASKNGLMEDISLMDSMYETNKEYLKGVDLYITAGELRLEEIQTTVLPELQERAKNSNDSLVQQELQDMTQFVDRLDKRLHDLKLTKQIIVQSAPQIRMIQSTSQVLAEKIQSSVMTAIPLWKNQITIALTLQTQRKAVEAQKLVTDTTNELLLKNSEMLRMNTVDTARENERGIIDVDTLKKTQENLILTIEETMQIQTEGRKNRKLAEAEIEKMEQDLKDRILQMHQEAGQDGRVSYAGTRDTVDQKVNYLDM